MKQLRIACIADSTPKAQAAYKALHARYSFAPLSTRKHPPHTVLVLGGDGFMLQTLHKYMKKKVAFYGMNCGTVGFLLNDYDVTTVI